MTDRERAELIADIARACYTEGDFVLSSGARSSFYIDAKLATYHPRTSLRLGRAVWELIRDRDVGAVGGLTLGSDAVAIAVMHAALNDGVELPAFSVRKEAKGHGRRKRVEGVCPPAGTRVAVVDDVVTSGRSILQAVEAAKERGWTVVVAVPVVDREEGAAPSIAGEGIEYRPFCTLTEIRAAHRAEAART